MEKRAGDYPPYMYVWAYMVCVCACACVCVCVCVWGGKQSTSSSSLRHVTDCLSEGKESGEGK